MELVRQLAAEVVEREPQASFELEVEEQYRNMRSMLDRHPEIVAAAETAIRRAGVEPVHSIIRGGTDGARLTERGLPTPNLFTGGQDYHSLREWASRAGHGRGCGDGGRADPLLGRVGARPPRSS